MAIPAPIEPGKRYLSRAASSLSPNASGPMPESNEEESLKDAWRTLRKSKAWIIVFALLGAGLAALACVVLPNQYQSTAVVQIGKDQTVQVDLTPNTNGPSLSENDTKTDLATHMAIISDNNTALTVISDLNLEKYKPFVFRPTFLGWLTGSNRRIKAEQGLPLSEAPARRGRLVKIFSKDLFVKNPPDTRLIAVTFINPDPQIAANVANDVVQRYVKFESEGQAGGVGLALLTSDLNGLKTKMDTDQENLADYERQTGLNNLILTTMGHGAGGGSITHIPVLDKLDLLNQELTAAEANRIGKEAIYKLTRTHNAGVVAGLASSSIPAIAASAVVTQGNGLELLQNLRQEQGALRLEYAADAIKYGAKNPRIVEMQNQLASIDKQISDELEQIDLRARNDYGVARQNEDELRVAFQAQQAAASELNQRAVTLGMLAQQAASSRQLYDGLYQQIQEASVQAGLRATNIRMTDPARPNDTPTKPDPRRYVAFGSAIGLFFGISTAFIREHLDETVKTPLQVDMLTQFPVLASIPLISGHGQKALSAGSFFLASGLDGESSPLLTRPRSAAAEAYRALRTSIVFAAAGQSLRTIAITSPLIGEGKTSVSYNTAIAFAHAGERVLLIDADLHHAQLHNYFGKSQAPGLSDILSGEESLGSSIQGHPTVGNLFLLPAGSSAALASELLGSAMFDALMDKLKQTYTLIILDTPPMLLVADAVLLAGRADATVAVIRADMTNRTAVERLTGILERNGSRTIGLVLNGVDTTSIDYYHAYGHKDSERYFEEN